MSSENQSKGRFLLKSAICVIFAPLLLISFQSGAQIVIGKLTNEQNEPVPFATIFVSETREGTISNSEGDFHLNLEQGIYHLTIRSLGYYQVEKEITLASDSLHLNVAMKRQEYEIKEVKVFPGKEDPAYFIIRKAIANAAYFREKIKHYEAELYIKSNFNFTNIPKIYQNKIEVNGKKLKEAFKEDMTYIIESQNKIIYDYPDKYKQEVVAKKSSLVGFDEPPVMGLMTSSFYDERPNEVISPLSSMALKHYNYQYEGFITVGNFDVFRIKVSGKRKSDELVDGYIYIVDKLWCIYNVDFNARLEFFPYHLKQQYENLGNENWMPVSHVIDGNFSILGLKGNFYYGASLKYTDIENNRNTVNQSITKEDNEPVIKDANKKETELRQKFNQITKKEELTNQDIKTAARLNRKIMKEQYKDSILVQNFQNNYKIEDKKDSLRTDTVKWESIRAIPLTPAEIKSYEVSDSLISIESVKTDSTKSNKKGKPFISKIFFGNGDFCKDSLVIFGYSGLIAPNKLLFNPVDGFKYSQKLNLEIIPDSGKRITLAPEIGYAFGRKAVFGKVVNNYRNILCKNNEFQLEFGKESKDFKPGNLGINETFNSLSSFFFAKNYMKLYGTSLLKIGTMQRLNKNVRAGLYGEYNHFIPLENNAEYLFSDKKQFSPNIPFGRLQSNSELAEQKSFVYSIWANFRKNQLKPWLEKSSYLSINDYYLFQLNYIQGLKNIFSSVSDFSHISLNFQQEANLTPSTGISWKFIAGYFFRSEQMHFSQYKHFQTVEVPLTLISFTHTFQLVNNYELNTNKKYLNIGAEYRTEYFLLRYLSVFNKRTWSESLHLNYLTTPELKNYTEVGYSLNNLFLIGNAGIFVGFKEGKFENAGFKISISAF